MNGMLSKLSKKETPHCGNELQKIETIINFPGTPPDKHKWKNIDTLNQKSHQKVDTGHQMHEHAT